MAGTFMFFCFVFFFLYFFFKTIYMFSSIVWTEWVRKPLCRPNIFYQIGAKSVTLAIKIKPFSEWLCGSELGAGCCCCFKLWLVKWLIVISDMYNLAVWYSKREMISLLVICLLCIFHTCHSLFTLPLCTVCALWRYGLSLSLSLCV